MATKGGALFQEKVKRLLSRQNGKPVLKSKRPLVLKDVVASRKPKKDEATCLTEMSLMMACWKLNSFTDGLCSAETKEFYACVAKAQAAMRNKSERTNVQGGRLPSKQVTTMLKKYPNPSSEI